jgi:uncharacterized membrane protein (UPF0127 family)
MHSERRTISLLGERGRVVCERLLLEPTFSIHTFFMRFAIDAVFLDREGEVVDVVSRLKPWRAATRFRARAVLELAAGEADRMQVRVGERLQLEEVAA